MPEDAAADNRTPFEAGTHQLETTQWLLLQFDPNLHWSDTPASHD
jgi:hypothetical protein